MSDNEPRKGNIKKGVGSTFGALYSEKVYGKGGFFEKTADLHDADRLRMEKEMAELLVKIDAEIDQSKKEELTGQIDSMLATVEANSEYEKYKRLNNMNYGAPRFMNDFKDFADEEWAFRFTQYLAENFDRGWVASAILNRVLPYQSKFLDKPWAKEIYLLCLDEEWNAYQALSFLPVFIDKPWAHEVLEKVAKMTDRGFLANARLLESKDWGRKILEVKKREVLSKAGADISSFYVLTQDFDGFINMPWAQKFVQDYVQKASVARENNINEFGSFIEKCIPYASIFPWVRDFLFWAAENVPKSFQFNLRLIPKDASYREDLINDLLRFSLDEHPDYILSCVYEDALSENSEQFQKKVLKHKEIIKVAVFKLLLKKKDLGFIISYLQLFKAEPWASNVILQALRDSEDMQVADQTVRSYDSYKDIPQALDIFKEACFKCPEAVFDSYDYDLPMKTASPFLKDLFEVLLQKDHKRYVLFDVKNMAKILSQPFGPEFLTHALEAYPGEMNLSKLEVDSPNAVISFLKAGKSSIIKRIYELYEFYAKNEIIPSYRWDEFFLVPEFVQGNMSPQEFIDITGDPGRCFAKLVEIGSVRQSSIHTPRLLEAMRGASLRFVRNINDLHNESNEVRFADVQNFNSQYLYTLMVNGGEEVFTSTFNGLYNRMKNAISNENISFHEFLDAQSFTGLMEFFRLCSRYGKLPEMLQGFTDEQQRDVFQRLISSIEDSDDPMQDSVSLIEIGTLIDDSNLLRFFQDKIGERYETLVKSNMGNKDDLLILYQLIASFIGKKSKNPWIKEMVKKYPIKKTNTIRSKDLFNKNHENVQEYFFYDDREAGENQQLWDGHNSFKSFIQFYGAKVEWDSEGNIKKISDGKYGDWTIKDFDSYVLISGAKEGRKMSIYANKPDSPEGNDEIEKILKDKNVKTLVVVHRGHSYHAPETIARIPAIAKIVSLGSCGGYQNIADVLKNAPEAHIISTKGTGTMAINDPVFRALNKAILDGKDISWPEFWSRITPLVEGNPNFKDYVPPHLNMGAIFIAMYNKAIEEEMAKK